MTQPRETQTSKRLPFRLWLLVAVHAAAELALAYFSELRGADLLFATFLAVVFAQISLLAMLAAFSESRVRRNLGAVGGLLFVFTTGVITIVRLNTPFILEFMGGIWIVFSTMFIAFVVLKTGGIFIVHVEPDHSTSPPASLQFQTRHLFWLTALVAVLMAPAKWIREHFDYHGVIGLVVGILLFVTTPLLALWAVLGRGRVGQRSSLILLASVAIGFVAHFYRQSDLRDVWFWPYLLGLQSAVMILSLLVVRSCGFRLLPNLGKPSPADRHS